MSQISYRFDAKWTSLDGYNSIMPRDITVTLPTNDKDLAEDIIGQMLDWGVSSEVVADVEMRPAVMLIEGGYLVGVDVICAMTRLASQYHAHSTEPWDFDSDCDLLDDHDELFIIDDFDNTDWGNKACWSALGAEVVRRFLAHKNIVANDRGLHVQIEAS